MNTVGNSNMVDFHRALFKGTVHADEDRDEHICEIYLDRVIPLQEQGTLLVQALDRINNPPGNGGHSKSHVGTWAMSMLKDIFHGRWAITPVQSNDPSGRYPDIVVEGHEGGILLPLMYCKLERKDGSVVTALSQLKVGINDAMKQLGSGKTYQDHSTYAYVQRGTEIGLFEYHNDETILAQQRIPHHNGFVPLIQEYLLTNEDGKTELINGVLAPPDLKTLDLVLDSQYWDVPCIFDIENEEHRKFVYALMELVRGNPPRRDFYGKLQYMNEVNILLIQ